VSSLFFRSDAGDDPSEEQARVSMANAPMGVRIDHLGRYKMPLLPGESGPKSGGDWVPRGVQSATNLAGAIVESRQLGIWDRERSQIGLALRPDLVERLSFATRKALAEGADFNERHTYKDLAAELELIHKEAKQTAGGNAAAQAGTNRHDVWETAVGRDESSLFGTPQINAQIQALNELLERKGLKRVLGLQERTVRNVHLRAAGRFDDVLITTRDIPFSASEGGIIRKGTLLMADLKTKKRAFWSWLEVRIQLAVYATAEYMLACDTYVPGPKFHVSQDWGVIMRMPADGGAPELSRCNLRVGLAHAELARAVCDARSEGKSVAAHREAIWPDTTNELEMGI
jgi:hypothetical protein